MSDLIDRQAALDVLHGYFDGMLETDTVCPKDLYNEIEALPSAQPTGTNTVQVEDCISRAAIVDAIEGVDWYHQNDSGEMVHGANSAEDQPWYKAEDIYAAIDGVPPAQPVEDARAMCGECDAWNKYKNYPQPEQFNPCTVCQEFDCAGCKFREGHNDGLNQQTGSD